MEFKLTYYDVAVQHFNHYMLRATPYIFSLSQKGEEKKLTIHQGDKNHGQTHL